MPFDETGQEFVRERDLFGEIDPKGKLDTFYIAELLSHHLAGSDDPEASLQAVYRFVESAWRHDKLVAGAGGAFGYREQRPEDEPVRQYAVYVTLVKRAVDVFGDPALASEWLSKPIKALDNKAPLQLLQEKQYSTSAVEMIEPIFMQIEHGIYV